MRKTQGIFNLPNNINKSTNLRVGNSERARVSRVNWEGVLQHESSAWLVAQARICDRDQEQGWICSWAVAWWWPAPLNKSKHCRRNEIEVEFEVSKIRGHCPMIHALSSPWTGPLSLKTPSKNQWIRVTVWLNCTSPS